MSKKQSTGRSQRRRRFSIGSAPLTSITKIDAQARGGETRQDYKDTRREKLDALDADEQATMCEKLHELAEELQNSIQTRFEVENSTER
ncbi:Rop family plasmid primer RNA-binding protein [Escherichia coli]|nr:Rop family plasmid primer RNA-binding protein [Escherichia coli]